MALMVSIQIIMIIVIEHSGRVFGLTVDAVSDLQNLPKDKIQRRFDYTIEEKTKYLRAMGKMEDRLILILDLEKIIDLDSEIIPEEIKQSINKEGGE